MEKDLIYKTKFWKVILSDDQTYLGRCVVMLNRNCGDLADLTHEELIDFLENVVKKLEKAFREVFKARMFNWTCLMNNAYLESNPKPQVHWHFRPRYNIDVKVLDEVFTDPNFGHHYKRNSDKVVSNEVREEIIKKVQAHV